MSLCISRAANALEKEIGLKKGDRAIIIMPKQPEWWLIYLACVRSGYHEKKNQLRTVVTYTALLFSIISGWTKSDTVMYVLLECHLLA